jgi:hypothetical protein
VSTIEAAPQHHELIGNAEWRPARIPGWPDAVTDADSRGVASQDRLSH